MALVVHIVLYDNPKTRFSPKIFSGEISVAYYEETTDAERLTIEQEFGLRQIEEKGPADTFYYHAGHSPLEAIEIANRLYESGKVDYAAPEWFSEGSLYSYCPNEGIFKEQWHLANSDSGGADLNVLPAWTPRSDQETVVNLTRSNSDVS